MDQLKSLRGIHGEGLVTFTLNGDKLHCVVDVFPAVA
jgi:hypothetical protein